LWANIAERRRMMNEYDTQLLPRELFQQTVAEMVPLGREQTSDDIGNAVAFLASDRAQSINGQALNVDGGIRMN
jgi:enoyl-[acyl-carrier-protein] reductase (NADH)